MGKKPPEMDGNARFFSVDEVRKIQGLPPETPEEREERKIRSAASAEKLRLRSEAEAAAREKSAEDARKKMDEDRAAVTRVLDAVMEAKHVGEFQRAAVDLVPKLNRLTEGQRKALREKFDAMITGTAIGGTVAEITALNAIGEALGRWRREAEPPPVMYRVKKKEVPVEESQKPVPTAWENVLALLPSWMRKK